MITIDPNLRGCGVAHWRNGVLIRAEYVKNPCESGRGYEAFVALAVAVGQSADTSKQVLIEHPRVYPGTPKTDLNDLLDVCGVGAAVALALRNFGPVQTVFPSEWKGTMKKAAMLDRIREKLTDVESAVVQKTNKSDTEDVLDAIGIGLWKLGRLNRVTYPGAVP